MNTKPHEIEWYIYAIFNKDGEVVYVGKTGCIADRMRRHKNKIKDYCNYTILKECTLDESVYWEYHYIRKYKKAGFKLLNVCDGATIPKKKEIKRLSDAQIKKCKEVLLEEKPVRKIITNMSNKCYVTKKVPA